jgi:UDP-N-acetylmuramate dehydrogenase
LPSVGANNKNAFMISFQEYVPLHTFTTFKLGGTARFFVRVGTVEEMREAVDRAKKGLIEIGTPTDIFVLGGGSNILVSDTGFNGLVIKNEIMGIEVEKRDGDSVFVTAGAGENWDDFVASMTERGFFGLENLSYIPGTVGAAPVQNIGAYGAEVAQFIHSVDALDIVTGKYVTFSGTECMFEYRDSFFKKNPGKYSISRVTFALSTTPVTNISYKDLKEFFAAANVSASITPAHIRAAVIEIRKKKLPDWHTIGTAGSFFKNPVISSEKYAELKAQYPELPHYPVAQAHHVKIPLAWVLDNVCGYKAKIRTTENGAPSAIGTYQNQALVIVNDYMKIPGATAASVVAFAQEIVDIVKTKTGIDIEPEVQYIGFK